jgi:hypothetical protein
MIQKKRLTRSYPLVSVLIRVEFSLTCSSS